MLKYLYLLFCSCIATTIGNIYHPMGHLKVKCIPNSYFCGCQGLSPALPLSELQMEPGICAFQLRNIAGG